MTSPATTDRSVVDVLRAAKERISDPERWTTGSYARDAAGLRTDANSQRACSWCGVGAVLVELDLALGMDAHCHPVGRVAVGLLEQAAENAVPFVNDQLGHAAILSTYDAALELAEAEQT
jgi:hypothetical protein